MTTSTEAAPETSANPWAGERLEQAVEAVLITQDKPITPGRIAEALAVGLDEGGAAAIRDAIDRLNASYDQTGRAFRIEHVSGGYRLMTLPEFAPAVAALLQSRAQTRLSRAAIETLAVIAYRQPITRAEIEAIRGVACGEVLRTLLDRRLIAIVGRAEELGRPMLYGASKRFLEHFGLASVKDLPPVSETTFFDSRPEPDPAPQPEAQPEAQLEAQPEDDANPDTDDSSEDTRE